jgi:hypothetical protein
VCSTQPKDFRIRPPAGCLYGPFATARKKPLYGTPNRGPQTEAGLTRSHGRGSTSPPDDPFHLDLALT